MQTNTASVYDCWFLWCVCVCVCVCLLSFVRIMSFMGSRHRLMPSTHRTYIINHPRLQHHNRVPPLPNQLRLRVIMDSSQAPSPSPASAAQTKQTESKMSKTNSLSLRVSGSESGSSAILYCRETLPSFNMAPSLLRWKDENDGSSPEDGPGGYNFSQRRMIKKDKRIVLLRHGQVRCGNVLTKSMHRMHLQLMRYKLTPTISGWD